MSLNNAKISVLVPVLNEQETLAQVVSALFAALADVELELVIVDDGSSDATPRILAELCSQHPEIRSLRHEHPRGKGAAIRTAIAAMSGDVLVIQDADLEYQPDDIPRLLTPILDGRADAVYGSRFTSPERSVNFFWTTLANQLVTLAANLVLNTNFSDLYTGYKAIRADLVRDMSLRSESFTIEAELTVKLHRLGARFFEVPIAYRARSFDEGKKIHAFDAVRALAGICWHRFTRIH